MQPIESSLFHKIASSDTTRTGPHPALVLLHGRGADENDLLGLVPHLDPRFLFVSVRAPFRFSWGGFTWYEIEEVGSPRQDQFTESYERLVQFIADVKKNYPVDPHRMFLLGFSMGTVMSFAFTLTKPSEIRGVVAHSGYIPETTSLEFRWAELGDTSFFVAHGTSDPVIPVNFGRRAKELLSKTKADLTYREYPMGHQVSEESLRDLSVWLQDKLDGSLKKQVARKKQE